MRFLERVPKPPGWVALYYLALLLALLGFIQSVRAVYAEDGFALDAWLLTEAHALESPGLTLLAQGLDRAGSVAALGPLTALLGLALWRTSRRSSVFLLLAFWGALAMNVFGKSTFARLRPDLYEPLVATTNFAFPSGHAMGSLALALALHAVARTHWPRARVWLFALALPLALAVGASRVYLQVHYPSDVLAGWALSSAWVLGLTLWYRRPWTFEPGRGTR